MTDAATGAAPPDLEAVSLALLQDALSILAAGDELEAVLDACARAVVERLGVAFARVWVLDQRSDVLVLRASAGMYTHLDGPHGRIRLGEFKIGRIAQDRRPHISNSVTTDPEISDPGWAVREGMVAFAGYPLVVGDELVGVLAMFGRAPISSAVLSVVASVADAIAAGVQRLQSAARADTALRALHTIGRILVGELDLDRAVQTVTDAATSMTGAAFGAFFYNVVDERGASYMLYSLSGVPRSAFERFPLPRATPVFAPTFRGEATVRVADVTADPRYGRMDPHRGMPEGHLPVRSYLATPVIDRDGEVIGGLFFGHPEAGRFMQEDELVVEGIAGYAAVAITNARHYAAEHSMALTLQQALLPDLGPAAALPGLEVAARYLPGTRSAHVGGDWYDVVDLGEGCVGLTIGDVAGHDAAAAAHMGTVRNVLRTLALQGHDPGSALAELDDIVGRGSGRTLVTVGHGVLDTTTGALVHASAGHLPPLLVPAQGEARFSAVATSPPVGIGLLRGTHPATATSPVGPGDAAVLFTDGLVERRGHSLDTRLEELRRAATGHAGLGAEALCDHLLAAAGADGSERRDDTAIVVVRRSSEAAAPC